MMTKKRKKQIRKWVKIIAIIYCMLGAALYFLQDKIIFHPKKLPPGYHYQFDMPFHEIDIPVTKEKNLSIVQFTVPDTVRRGIVLYFHGNRDNINRYAKNVKIFTDQHYEVWMLDYPGFGKSTGKRSEKVLYEDALLFYKMAIGQIAADSIIIYGKSLGTCIASQLASVRDCKKLILETPYYSMTSLARHYFFLYPVVPMSKYRFPTNEYFNYIKSPIYIFHGTRDRVIPYRQAQRLAKDFPIVTLFTIPKGGHNNLNSFPLFQKELTALLQP